MPLCSECVQVTSDRPVAESRFSRKSLQEADVQDGSTPVSAGPSRPLCFLQSRNVGQWGSFPLFSPILLSLSGGFWSKYAALGCTAPSASTSMGRLVSTCCAGARGVHQGCESLCLSAHQCSRSTGRGWGQWRQLPDPPVLVMAPLLQARPSRRPCPCVRSGHLAAWWLQKPRLAAPRAPTAILHPPASACQSRRGGASLPRAECQSCRRMESPPWQRHRRQLLAWGTPRGGSWLRGSTACVQSPWAIRRWVFFHTPLKRRGQKSAPAPAQWPGCSSCTDWGWWHCLDMEGHCPSVWPCGRFSRRVSFLLQKPRAPTAVSDGAFSACAPQVAFLAP